MDHLSTSKSEIDFSYDSVPYPILTFSQTHPDMLATMSRFFGMGAADPTECRVLELGCASGANLLSMAYTLPQSDFIGIDLSAVQIDKARTAARELGISNASFEQHDITKLDPDQLGKYDYIVAHGVYSWVPEPVRKSVLSINSNCLAENGIGFISYNAYPGCHAGQMVWEAMRFHVREVSPWEKKVNEGKKFLAALANSSKRDPALQSLIRQELNRILATQAESVFHDELEETNQPFYFHQFVAEAKAFGLKYLGEAEPTWLDFGHMPEDVQRFLKAMGSDVERLEQYLDFMRCTRFRNNMVCRANIELTGRPETDSFKRYFLASQLRAVSETEEITTGKPKKFEQPDGVSVSVDHPLTKAVLVYLGERWPHRVQFDELMREASKMIAGCNESDLSAEVERAIGYLIPAFHAGAVRLHSYQPSYATTLSEYPRANPFARWQIRVGCRAVAILTEPDIEPENNLIGQLIPLLDGTRNHQDLIEEMKKMTIVPPEQRDEFISSLPEVVDTNLRTILNAGLLI